MTCDRKLRYKSRIYAMCVAIHRVHEGSPPLRVYRCPQCGKWHLTKRVPDLSAEGVVR